MPATPNTILAFDCSTGPCSVALWQEGKIISYAKEEEASKQASLLIPMIEAQLKANNLWYGSLTGIATTVGPGSFTGIRIGLAAAKGIAMAARLPMVGITTLETVAFAAREKIPANTPIIGVLNAGKGQVYRQTFSNSGNLTALGAPDMVDYSDILLGLPQQQYVLAGNGAKLVATSPLYTNCDGITHPDAKIVAAISAAAPERFTGYSHITPLYIRPPDAKLMAS